MTKVYSCHDTLYKNFQFVFPHMKIIPCIFIDFLFIWLMMFYQIATFESEKGKNY